VTACDDNPRLCWNLNDTPPPSRRITEFASQLALYRGGADVNSQPERSGSTYRGGFLERAGAGGSANHEIAFVPAVELADGIEDRLADLDERRTNPYSSPIPQRTFADLSTVTGNDFFER
jgi:hypothetical protein